MADFICGRCDSDTVASEAQLVDTEAGQSFWCTECVEAREDEQEAGRRAAAGHCTFPDCERAASRRGLCSAHAAQRRRGKELAPLRIRATVDRTDPESVSVYNRVTRDRELYGLTAVQSAIIRDTAVCHVCGSDTPAGRGWHIDHCHSTGVVRGLLCMRCNTGIGMFRDDPEILSAAIAYLVQDHSSAPWNQQETALVDSRE